MRKGQMFIVTMVFLVGMIFVIQQSLFIYSSVDPSVPQRDNDFFIVENFRRVGEDVVKTSSACEYGKSNSLEYNLDEVVSFMNFQRPKEGFTITTDYSVNCTDWNTTEPVLDLGFNIFGKNIETQGVFKFLTTGSFFPDSPECGDGLCSWGEICSADCATETYCLDGVDNDEDGFTDGADTDCQGGPVGAGIIFANDPSEIVVNQADGPINILTIYSTDLIQGNDYMVFASTEVRTSQFSERANTRVSYDGSDIFSTDEEQDPSGGSDTSWVYSTFFKFTPGPSGDLSLVGETITVGGSTTYDESSLIAFPLTDLIEGSDYFYNEYTTVMDGCSDNFPDNIGASISFTPDGASDYIIFGTSRGDINSIGDDLYRMELHNGTQLALVERDGENSLDESVISLMRVLKSPPAVPTAYTLRFQCNNVHSHLNSQLFILKLDSFEDHSLNHVDEDANTGFPFEIRSTTDMSLSQPGKVVVFWGAAYVHSLGGVNSDKVKLRGDFDSIERFNTGDNHLRSWNLASNPDGADRQYAIFFDVFDPGDTSSHVYNLQMSTSVSGGPDEYHSRQAEVVVFSENLAPPPPITCPDSLCEEFEVCGADCNEETFCSDGVDNDENGDTDCADAFCTGDPACIVITCGQGHTDLGNGVCIANLSDPLLDGHIQDITGIYARTDALDKITIGDPGGVDFVRGYVEWNISSIPPGADIIEVQFHYDGEIALSAETSYIHHMGVQPSSLPDDFNPGGSNHLIWNYSGNGTAYLENNDVFPELGVQDVGDTGPFWDARPRSDLQAAIDSNQPWFSLGFRTGEQVGDYAGFRSEEDPLGPSPTLIVIYNVTPIGYQNLTISGCQELNQSFTNYILDQDIATTGSCFTVTGDYISLFGNGHSVIGDGDVGDYAIRINDRSNIIIRDLVITDFNRGVNFIDTTYSLVFNNTLSNNSEFGIGVFTSHMNVFQNNIAENNTRRSIYLSGSTNNSIEGNQMNKNSEEGIHLTSSSNNNIIKNNNVGSNGLDGIYVWNSNGNEIRNNIAGSNQQHGIHILTNSENTVIMGNTINSNSQHGIFIESDNGSILGNTANNNFGAGIYVSNSGGHIIESNTANSNDNWRGGIYIENSDYNKIRFNNANLQTFGGGITLLNSNNNIINNNFAFTNDEDGIHLDGSSNNQINYNTLNEAQDNDGIEISNSHNNTIIGNLADNNGNIGIRLISSNNNTVKGNSADSNTFYGIYLSGSSNNTIEENSANFHSTFHGISLNSNSNNNTIKNNTAQSNEYGIYVSGSNGNVITYNNASMNNLNGITLSSAILNNITNNDVSFNTWGDGIAISLGGNNTIINNTANNNTYGIWIRTTSFSNLIYNNTINNNIQDGILVSEGSHDNIIAGNIANNNSDDGITISGSLGNVLIYNLATNNAENGFYLTGVSGSSLSNNIGCGNALFDLSCDVAESNTADTTFIDTRNNCNFVVSTQFPCSAADTLWGEGFGPCPGPNQRLYDGQCVTCSGLMNAGYCWYEGNLGESCNDACATHDGIYPDPNPGSLGGCDWINDPISCSTCNLFNPGAACVGSNTLGPVFFTNSGNCLWHLDTSNNCAGTNGLTRRQCACNT